MIHTDLVKILQSYNGKPVSIGFLAYKLETIPENVCRAIKRLQKRHVMIVFDENDEDQLVSLKE